MNWFWHKPKLPAEWKEALLRKSKKRQLKTMIAHSLILDNPIGASGTMRCGDPVCNFKAQFVPTTEIPEKCPLCGLRWRYCTTEYDPSLPPDSVAELYSRRVPQHKFFLADDHGNIRHYALAYLRS